MVHTQNVLTMIDCVRDATRISVKRGLLHFTFFTRTNTPSRGKQWDDSCWWQRRQSEKSDARRLFRRCVLLS
jgi:hypothetical protein